MFVGKFSGEVSGENSGDAKENHKNKGGFLGLSKIRLISQENFVWVGILSF